MFEPVTTSWWSSLGRLREGSPAGGSLSVEVGFQFHSREASSCPLCFRLAVQAPGFLLWPLCLSAMAPPQNYGSSPEWTP